MRTILHQIKFTRGHDRHWGMPCCQGIYKTTEQDQWLWFDWSSPGIRLPNIRSTSKLWANLAIISVLGVRTWKERGPTGGGLNTLRQLLLQLLLERQGTSRGLRLSVRKGKQLSGAQLLVAHLLLLACAMCIYLWAGLEFLKLTSVPVDKFASEHLGQVSKSECEKRGRGVFHVKRFLPSVECMLLKAISHQC